MSNREPWGKDRRQIENLRDVKESIPHNTGLKTPPESVRVRRGQTVEVIQLSSCIDSGTNFS